MSPPLLCCRVGRVLSLHRHHHLCMKQIDVMLDIVVASGSANTRFSPTELQIRDEVLPLFRKLLDKVSDSRLSSPLTSLKRWIRHAECHISADPPYWMPTAMGLAAFLQQVSEGGRQQR